MIGITAEDFEIETDDDRFFGCLKCYFCQGEPQTCCDNMNKELVSLVLDVEEKLDTNCYENGIHYLLKKKDGSN